MSPGELQKDYCWVVVFVVVFIHLIPLLSYPSTAHPSTDFFIFYFFAKENIMTSAASWVFKDPWSWCKLTCLCPMPPRPGNLPDFLRVSHRNGRQTSPPMSQEHQSWLTCLYVACFSLLTVVCWTWVPLWGPCSLGSHRKWMCFSESQVQPTQKQQKHRLFHRQANSERGKHLLTLFYPQQYE